MIGMMKRREQILVLMGLLCLLLCVGSGFWVKAISQKMEPEAPPVKPNVVYPYDWPQWHGVRRDNCSDETGLLESWPSVGPPLVWTYEGLGEGWSSPTIVGDAIYVTGVKDKQEWLFCLNRKGELLWQCPYGKVPRRYPGTRATGTYDEGFLFLTSGVGELVCFDTEQALIQWKLNAFAMFEGKSHHFGISESPVVYQDKVLFTPGGTRTTVVAFDKVTGAVRWESTSLNDSTAYVSPVIVDHDGQAMFITVTGHYILGLDPDNGEILWTYPYVENHFTRRSDKPLVQNAVTPIYHEGQVFVTSGYDHVGIKLQIAPDARSVSVVWVNDTLDCHHGGVVLHEGYLYGSSWHSNFDGNWVCLDWESGQVQYDEHWFGKGSAHFADGKLYCYEARKGHVALVEASPHAFKVISSFQVTQGTGEHWAHPFVCGSWLYVRHGDVLLVYDLALNDA